MFIFHKYFEKKMFTKINYSFSRKIQPQKFTAPIFTDCQIMKSRDLLSTLGKSFFALFLSAASFFGHAASYSLPSGFGTAPFTGCTLTAGPIYTCGSLTIAAGDSVTVTSSMTLKGSSFSLGVGSSFTTSNGAVVTVALTTIRIGNSAIITANLAGGEDMTIGTNATVTGNITDAGKTVAIASGTVVYGNVTAATIDFNGGTGAVYGKCSPTSPNCYDLHHMEMVHNGSALTCTPKAITILGCSTPTSSCNGVPANQTASTFAFTPTAIAGAQWCTDSVCSSPIAGSITISTGTTVYLRDTAVRTDLIAAKTAKAYSTTALCTNTSTGLTNTTTACNLSYQTSGFLVSVPNHTSCTSQTVTMQAVQTSATANTCVAAFQNVNRNVQLSMGYSNPSTGNKTASFNYVTSSGGNSSSVASLSTSAASPTTLSGLYFDNSGKATLTGFQYPDVGQVSLSPAYSGSAATGDTGLSMAAVSGNSFIAAPASFLFGAVSSPQVAGNPVPITVTAQNGCSTPATVSNFGKESTAQTVTLTSTNPQPALGNATAINQIVTGFNSGAASTSITWMEVGTIDLVATSSNYLGSGISPTSTKAGLGNFIPSYFDTQITSACPSGGFSYSGQPFSTTVTAHAVGGATTKNYGGATWAKTVTLTDKNSIAGALSPSTISASQFANGYATASETFTFNSAKTTPSTISLKAVDTNSVSSNAANEASALIVSGRLRALNSYGSEMLAMTVPVAAQYWNGLGWITNTTDNCTTIPVPSSASGLVFGGNLTAAKTTPSMNGFTSGNATVTGGVADLKFTAPGKGNSGSIDITLSSPVWLTYPWASLSNSNPKAKAVFGVYKSPLIYMRESY